MDRSPADLRLLPLLQGLVADANAGVVDAELFGKMCAAVCAAGVPLARSALQMENLHPVYYGYCLHWEAGRMAHLLERSREFGASEEFRLTPYMTALREGGWRWRAQDGPADLPLVRELAVTGVTDFMAEIVGAGGTLPPGITWATRATCGFAAHDAAFLRALGPLLVPVFGLGAERRKLDAVLRTYLGGAPGREVLRGQIRRSTSPASAARSTSRAASRPWPSASPSRWSQRPWSPTLPARADGAWVGTSCAACGRLWS